MIKFSIPDYYGHADLVFKFLDLQQMYPHYFYDNRIIDSAYGLPANLIWNGGRIFNRTNLCQQQAYEMFDAYAQYENFHLRHTCTNCMLTEELYLDHNCNTWIKYCEREGDSIIIYDDKLMEYLKTKYPKYTYIISTTKRIDDIKIYNEYSKNNLTVLDYRFNHDEDFLKKLEYPQNIEILCAESCIDNCPNREEHYRSISISQLNTPNHPYYVCPFATDENNISVFYDKIMKRNHAITNEYIDYLYNTYGFCNFKISGRITMLPIYVESICYYLVKPEYRNTINNIVMQNILGGNY